MNNYMLLFCLADKLFKMTTTDKWNKKKKEKKEKESRKSKKRRRKRKKEKEKQKEECAVLCSFRMYNVCICCNAHCNSIIWRNGDDALMLQKQILMMQQIVLIILMDANEQDFMVQICLANCHSSWLSCDQHAYMQCVIQFSCVLQLIFTGKFHFQ